MHVNWANADDEPLIDDNGVAVVRYQARRLEELEKLYKDEQVTRKRYFNQVGSSLCPHSVARVGKQ